MHYDPERERELEQAEITRLKAELKLMNSKCKNLFAAISCMWLVTLIILFL